MKNSFYDGLLVSISKIMRDRRLTQAAMAEYMEVSPGTFSKILSGTSHLSFAHISKLARALAISEIDLMTYPEKYRKLEDPSPDPVEAVLQIKLTKDKKDQVLKLVFGDNNIEILNL